MKAIGGVIKLKKRKNYLSFRRKTRERISILNSTGSLRGLRDLNSLRTLLMGSNSPPGYSHPGFNNETEHDGVTLPQTGTEHVQAELKDIKLNVQIPNVSGKIYNLPRQHDRFQFSTDAMTRAHPFHSLSKIN